MNRFLQAIKYYSKAIWEGIIEGQKRRAEFYVKNNRYID